MKKPETISEIINDERYDPETLQLREPVGSKPDVLITDDTQSQAITAIDVVETLRMSLKAISVLSATSSQTLVDYHIAQLKRVLCRYDKSVTDNAIDVDNLTEEKAGDKELQKVAHDYSMTMNQVVAYMDMCEQVNGNMEGTGLIAVPFWFYEQYVSLQESNKALTSQTDSLLATISEVEKKAKEEKGTIAELGLEMPQRKNIITGITTPYIAGVTGARLGDEHLDPEHIYIPTGRKS